MQRRESIYLLYPQGISQARAESLFAGKANKPPKLTTKAMRATVEDLGKHNNIRSVEFDADTILDGDGMKAYNSRYGSAGMAANSKIEVIPIVGSLSKYSHIDWDAFEYVRGTHDIIAQLGSAINDTEVKAIVLYIDSGGGAVDGIHELAQVIRNSPKPIFAAISGMAASGAYWLAAQCGKIFTISPETQVGSIGVYYMHVDESKFLDENGFKVTYVTSTGSPDKVVAPSSAPLSDEDRAKIVAMIDPIKANFVKAVKDGRSSTLKDDSTIFQGNVFNADQAKKLGLIDGVKSFDDIIIEAQREGGRVDRANRRDNTAANAKAENLNINIMNPKDIFGDLIGKDTKITSPITLTAEQATALNENVGNLQASVAELTAKVETLTTEKTALQAKIDGFKPAADASPALAELQAKFDTAITEKTELQTKLDAEAQSAKEAIEAKAELETKLTAASTDLDKVKADLTASQTAFNALAKATGKPFKAEKAETGGDVSAARTDKLAGRTLA